MTNSKYPDGDKVHRGIVERPDDAVKRRRASPSVIAESRLAHRFQRGLAIVLDSRSREVVAVPVSAWCGKTPPRLAARRARADTVLGFVAELHAAAVARLKLTGYLDGVCYIFHHQGSEPTGLGSLGLAVVRSWWFHRVQATIGRFRPEASQWTHDRRAEV